MSFVERLQAYLDAGFPVLAVTTAEESRAELDLVAAARGTERRAFYWSVTEGIVGLTEKRREPNHAKNPMGALTWAEQAGADSVVILRDFHFYLQNPEILRKLRDLTKLFRTTNQSLVLLGVRCQLPPEVEKEVTVLEYALPDRAYLRQLMERVLQSARASNPHPEAAIPEPSDVVRERAIEAALGLTAFEAENAFALSLVVKRAVDPDLINEEKAAAVRKSGVLEVIQSADTLESVGGVSVLKEWLRKRRRAFSPQARDFGLPAPRGIILIGVPGSGKSLLAKSVATTWKLPLLRLDIGKVFGSLVGESEGNLRRALATAEAASPAVLWIDEIEKGLSGVASSNRSDAGTTARVFGHFLTWMQEKRAPVFVVATANAIEALPPEFLRKGRFDEIFFVDLPTEAEREEILRIHLARRKREMEEAAVRELARMSDGYTGAELEEAVVSALFDAFDDTQRDLHPADVMQSLTAMTPLSVMMSTEIKALREWARHRARPASSAPHPESVPAQGVRRMRLGREEA
ncbi:MAG: AAA family ATPase [Myxococcota bacterium]